MISATTALLFLAGCGGPGSNEASTASDGGAPQRAAKPETLSQNGGAAPGSAGSSGNQSDQTQPVKLAPVTGRSIIYTANLRVQAKNVSDAASRAKQMVMAVGGYVENETAASDPGTATITFRVPADRYATVLEQLGGQLGTRLSLKQQAQDVTQEVADVESRVKSAEAALASFRKLLDRANTVGEVLNVEREMARREADLESLQARQKSLAQQTSFATIALQLDAPPKAPVAQAKGSGGFMGGLRSGWDAFTAILAGLAVALGWLLPFVAVIALIGLPAWVFRARIRRFFVRPGATPPTAG